MRSSKSRSRSKTNRNRSVGNIVNRVFDSSGPEGKVRGTPQQIIDKYNLLARDAQLANDRVATENFQQHAEHYLRMLSEAQREAEARREQQDQQSRDRQQPQPDQRGGTEAEGKPAAKPTEVSAGSEDTEAYDAAGESSLVETPEAAATGEEPAKPAASEAPEKPKRARRPRSRAPKAAETGAEGGQAPDAQVASEPPAQEASDPAASQPDAGGSGQDGDGGAKAAAE